VQLPYLIKWLFGLDVKEAKEEQAKQIDNDFREDRLGVNTTLLEGYLIGIKIGEDYYLPVLYNLLGEIKEDMKILGLKSSPLSLDNTLVLNNNVLDIIKRER